MTNAEMILQWIIAHRGEPECNIYICELAEKMDEETVIEALDHIRGGYYIPDDPEGYADSLEDPNEVFAEQVCKHCYAIKRNRKIADNRKHYAKVCAKRGEIV